MTTPLSAAQTSCTVLLSQIQQKNVNFYSLGRIEGTAMFDLVESGTRQRAVSVLFF